MTTSLATTLWRANADLARACLHDPLVRGIADGSLPIECFRAYVAQDAYFLEAFARAYALALARSPDRQGLDHFYALIGGVLEELRLHAAYATRWQVDLSRTVPAASTRAYTDFLLATASTQRVGETCAAMTPCMRLYAYLGQQLAAAAFQSVSGTRYQEWIDTYAAPEFEALAATLEALLERYASDTESVRGAYRRAMQLELAFFQAQILSSGTRAHLVDAETFLEKVSASSARSGTVEPWRSTSFALAACCWLRVSRRPRGACCARVCS